MAAPDPKHPTYATEAIPSDVKNGLFLGNTALDNVVSCVIAMGAELWSTKRRLHVMQAVMAKNGIPSELTEKYARTAAEPRAPRPGTRAPPMRAHSSAVRAAGS